VRVKITAKNYGIEKLSYGKKYFIAYAGTSYGEEFLFTRKNRIELCEYRKENEKLIKVSSYWTSRKQLKELLNLGVIHWMSEIQ